MRKSIIFLVVLLVIATFSSCSSGTSEKGNDVNDSIQSAVETEDQSKVETEETTENSSEESVIEEEKEQFCTSTPNITIEGMYVDDSYVDDDNSALKIVYLFYEYHPDENNGKIDSKYTKITINGNNSYESEHINSWAKYVRNYYYSAYIEDVYIGDSLKVLATFKIPEADLKAGRTITVSDTQLPDEEKLLLKTDDIIHCNGQDEVAEKADYNGYIEECELREAADSTQTQFVRNCINGYYYEFTVYYGTTGVDMEVEFYAPNRFEVRTEIGGGGTGTYEVTNGYLMCTYDATGTVLEMPYEHLGNDIDLDVSAPFQINE